MTIKSDQICLQLPIVDICKPLSSIDQSLLYEACKEWGFFYITNHGITKDFYHKVRSMSNQVFNLPLRDKQKIGPTSSIATYTPHFIASPFYESLRVSGPSYYESAKESSDPLFTKTNLDFCKTMEQYCETMTHLCKRITSILLNCLGDGLESKYYNSEFGLCQGYLRINNYSKPEKLEEIEGLGKHTDMSCITILYPDEIGGLQVRSKCGDQWIDIVPSEGTLVVNIGDLLQAWSNGELRSSAHRVVLKQPVNRFSLAFFWCFEDEKIVSAPEDVVGKGEMRKYRAFVCEDYINFRVNSVVVGRFDKVGCTVDDFALKSPTEISCLKSSLVSTDSSPCCKCNDVVSVE